MAVLEVELNPTDYLVEKVKDYYKVKEGIDTNVNKEDSHAVGIIVAGGEEVSEKVIGKIIYYHKNIATEVNAKGIGTFDLVTFHQKLLIRLDQTKNNY